MFLLCLTTLASIMSETRHCPSLWAATAQPGPICPALTTDEETDVAIIGAGFTGLSAALYLAKAGKSVRVLEAVESGWGASGRNGGQVNPAWKLLPEAIELRYGPERGQRVSAMAGTTCDLVFELIQRHDIHCDAIRPGYVQGAYGKCGIQATQDWVRQWSQRGAPVEWLDKQATAQLLGTDAYDGAMLDHRGGNIQPLSYVRGLAHAAITTGASIHGDTTVTKIEQAGTDWLLTTPNGDVIAEQILLCTNGYTDKLWPGLRDAVVPVTSFVTATRPLEKEILQAILPQRHAVSETLRVQVYYRLDRDGRFVIGGRGNLFSNAHHGDDRHLRTTACALFPSLSQADWEYHWSGYVAMTWDYTPRLMALAPGVFAGMGYNGRGIAMATMMGKQLAMAVLGEDPELPVEPLVHIPFHSFRQLGISWHLLKGRWLDRTDRLDYIKGRC